MEMVGMVLYYPHHTICVDPTLTISGLIQEGCKWCQLISLVQGAQRCFAISMFGTYQVFSNMEMVQMVLYHPHFTMSSHFSWPNFDYIWADPGGMDVMLVGISGPRSPKTCWHIHSRPIQRVLEHGNGVHCPAPPSDHHYQSFLFAQELWLNLTGSRILEGYRWCWWIPVVQGAQRWVAISMLDTYKVFYNWEIVWIVLYQPHLTISGRFMFTQLWLIWA